MNYNELYNDKTKEDSNLVAPTYNGRINLIDQPNTDVLFKMKEKIGLKNKATEYRDALNGIWETNALSEVFFSAENVQIIQNGLRAGVYKMSEDKYVIAPQNVDTLKIIMRSIYLQHAEHYDTNITGQVERLNKLVLDYAVPSVYGEVKGYIKYCEDQTSLAVPMSRGYHSDRDYKQLIAKPFM
jgi:hypothetical protein